MSSHSARAATSPNGIDPATRARFISVRQEPAKAFRDPGSELLAGTEPGGEHLAVPASELPGKPYLRHLRRHRRRLLPPVRLPPHRALTLLSPDHCRTEATG